MRLADKLFFCSAILYTIDIAARHLAHISPGGPPSFSDNPAVYVFLVLAVIEYAKLFVPWLKDFIPKAKEWKKKKGQQLEDLESEIKSYDVSKQSDT